MVRTQVQLTPQQIRELRQLSAVSGQSIAELVRQGVALYLASQQLSHQQARIDRAVGVATKFASGSKDGSREHDRHLADAFRQ